MSGTTRKLAFEVAEADAGERIDRVLAARVPGLSRRKARVLLEIGGVFVDRRRVKVASRKLRAGQRVEVHLGGALERAKKAVGQSARQADADRLPRFRVVHEDEAIVVVDKPAGLITAPTPESDRGNLADGLLRGVDRGQPRQQIFVVHRLDRETSGLLVFARTEEANRYLAERFQRHALVREYVAVVAGRLTAPTGSSIDGVSRGSIDDATGGSIDSAIDGVSRGSIDGATGGSIDGSITVDAEIKGRRAVTHLVVDEHVGDEATVLRARLETGRTHQIRIHCLGIGHPVLGDRRYRRAGFAETLAVPPPRMALHATTLGITHPTTGEAMEWHSPLPDDLAGWLATLRRHAASAEPRRKPRRKTMIERHIFIRLTERYADQRDQIANYTFDVLRRLPGVNAVTVGTPADDHASAAWDLGLTVTFDSLDAVKAYSVDPDHRELVDEYLHPRIDVIKAWNFVVER